NPARRRHDVYDPGCIDTDDVRPIMLEIAAGGWGDWHPCPVESIPAIPDEVWEDREQYRDEPLRDRPPSAAVANDHGVDLEYVLRRAREHSHWIVLPCHDATDSREGELASQGFGVRQAQDLEPAVSHGLGQELRVLVDDHRSEVELSTLELDELFFDTLG